MSMITHAKVPAVWIHFLGVLPSQLTSQWVKSGLALKWSPAVVPDNVQTVSISKPFQQVTLIYFNPAPEFWRAINRVFKSNSWEDSLEDPYLLINMAFESWYELIDTSAWEVNDLSREAEKVCHLSSPAACARSRDFQTKDEG
jgi:hypothetical protein